MYNRKEMELEAAELLIEAKCQRLRGQCEELAKCKTTDVTWGRKLKAVLEALDGERYASEYLAQVKSEQDRPAP